LAQKNEIFKKLAQLMWYDKNGAGAYMVERIEVAGSTLFILDIILWVTTLIALILAF